MAQVIPFMVCINSEFRPGSLFFVPRTLPFLLIFLLLKTDAVTASIFTVVLQETGAATRVPSCCVSVLYETETMERSV